MKACAPFFAAFAVFLLANTASAWGNVTSKHICGEAVKLVWGEGALDECVPVKDTVLLGELCDTTERILGEEYGELCLEAIYGGVDLHPATLSMDVYEDIHNHYDFLHCPITQGGSAKWICGSRQERRAYDISLKWFDAARNAPNRCSRIYYFCVGSSYYSDTINSLRQVNHIVNECDINIHASIDRAIENGLEMYGSNQLCRFDNLKRGSHHRHYKQRMGESSNTVNKAITNLTYVGLEIRDLPYRKKKGVVVLANSIDYPLASGLISYLAESGLNVLHSNASEFEQLRYNDKLIILGGHMSPEGVGDIASTVLTSSQKQSLLEKGARHVYVTEGLWQSGQDVVVVAGNRKEDTRGAWMNNKQAILDAVSRGGDKLG